MARSRRFVSVRLLACLSTLVAGWGFTLTPAAASTATASAGTPTAAAPRASAWGLSGVSTWVGAVPAALTPGAPVSFSGGDVASLPTSTQVFKGLTGAVGAWKTFTVPSTVLPAAAAGSVWVTVRASGASKAGQVSLRPAGATGTGTNVVDYPASQSAVATSVVRLGETGLQVMTNGGSPTVTVEINAWVPKTSALVVPSTPVPAGAVPVTSTVTKALTVAGVGGVPADASSVLLQVRTGAASAAGQLALWSGTNTVPTTGTGFPVAPHTFLTSVQPTAGQIWLRTLKGTATATVKVLGWSAGPTSLAGASRGAALPNVPADATNHQVNVAGVNGVPSQGVKIAWVAISAPTGAVVKLWDDQAGTEPPEQTITSRGGVITVPARLSPSGSLDAAVTGTAAARLLVVGWSVDTSGQQVSFVPKSTTTLVGPSEITGQSGSKVTVDKAATAPPVGGYVLVRPRDGGAPYLGHVSAKRTLANGNDVLTLGAADLHDAFADYDVSYHGHGRDNLTSAASKRSLLHTLTGTSSPRGGGSRIPLGLNAWKCTADVSSDQIIHTDIDVNLTPFLDLDLSQRYFDFSVRGQVIATVTLGSGVSASCTLESEHPLVTIPVGATGLALKIGVDATASLDTSGSLTFTNTTNAYGSIYYDAGDLDHFATAHNSSDVDAKGKVEVSLDLGIDAAIGPMQPPGTEEFLTASVSVKLGTRFTIGPPPFMRGPTCLDLTGTPYLQIGADLVVAFFADVSIDLPPIDLGEVTLYRGPCWGYSGTITWQIIGSSPYGWSGCTISGCTDYHVDEQMTKTLIPQPAIYTSQVNGPPFVSQPYTWSFRSTETVNDQVSGCLTTWNIPATTGNETSEIPEHQVLFTESVDSIDPGAGWVLTRQTPIDAGDGVPGTVTSGGPWPCTNGTTDATLPINDHDAVYTRSAGDPVFLDARKVQLTLPYQSATVVGMAKINLVRALYPR